MVQLNTIYDKTLKEKIFILKGEEGYARSTDCILNEILHDDGADVDPETHRRIDWNSHMEHMLLEFRVDVLRDIGASYVVLYDNDEVLGSYPFDTNSHYIDFKYESAIEDNRLKFDYGVEHNLYAKYMGNKNCLKSKSKIYTFEELLPQAYTSTLSFKDLKPLDEYYDVGVVNIDVELSADDLFIGKTIKLYNGNTLVGTEETGDEGIASFSVNFTTGIHTLTAIFEGDDELSYAECNQDIVVGYHFGSLNAPSSVLNNEDILLKIFANTPSGIPVTGISVQLYSGSNPVSESQVTNSSGEATLTIQNSVFESIVDEDGNINYYCKSSDVESRTFTTKWYSDAVISEFQTDITIISNSTYATLTGLIDGVSSPVKVTLDNSIGTVETDDTGLFNVRYWGKSQGDTTITATIPDDSATVNIEDVTQYWDKAGTSHNVGYTVDRGTVTSETNGWKFNGNSRIYFGKSVSTYGLDSMSIEFKVISASGVGGINYVSTNVSANDIIRIESRPSSNIVTLYKNGTLVDNYRGNIRTCLEIASTNGYLILDKLKLKRLS